MLHHCEERALINATPEDVFAYVDDPSRFSSHMSRSSWMMGGGRMDVSLDEGRGQEVGSHIRLRGKVFLFEIFLDEVITFRKPPREKIWETVGDPKLLVIGRYQMGIELEPQDGHSLLRVFIDFDMPVRKVWLGQLFGMVYAKWCVKQMIKGTQDHFARRH